MAERITQYKERCLGRTPGPWGGAGGQSSWVPGKGWRSPAGFLGPQRAGTHSPALVQAGTCKQQQQQHYWWDERQWVHWRVQVRDGVAGRCRHQAGLPSPLLHSPDTALALPPASPPVGQRQARQEQTPGATWTVPPRPLCPGCRLGHRVSGTRRENQALGQSVMGIGGITRDSIQHWFFPRINAQQTHCGC